MPEKTDTVQPEGISVVSQPAKEPSKDPAPNTAVQDVKETPETVTAPPKNDALPLVTPGFTGAGAPGKTAPLSGPIVKAPGAAATPQGVGPALVSRPARVPVAADVAKGASKAASVSKGTTGEADATGVTFVKNRTNEIIVLPNGKTYKFRKSKETVYDPDVIKGLRQVAKKYDIFEDEPAAPEATPAS